MKNLKARLTESLLAYHPEVINYEEFKHAAIFLPLVKIDGKWSLLFEKRTNNIAQGGEICFPGGRVERVEMNNPLLTAVRETSEELGLSISVIDVIQRLPRLITPDGKLIDAFIGTIDIDCLEGLTINPDEVKHVFHIPLAEIKEIELQQYSIQSQNFSASSVNDDAGDLLPVEKLGLPERYIGSWGKKKYSVYYFEYKDEKIWGLTARYVKYIQGLLG
jgi:8-oxo-dGTP pyrophosphatase MutT (NUDIX family)